MPLAPPGFQRFLDTPVLAGMKSQDGDAPAGVQASRKVAEERLERGELVIHRDAKRLEDAADREFLALFVNTGAGVLHRHGKGPGGGERTPGKGVGERP